MATITGFTSARMLDIEDNSIVDGEVIGDNLMLTKHNGTVINAGSVRGPTGSPGITSGELAAGLAGAATVTQMNTEITNRTNGDNALTSSINTEITNRTNADNAEIAIRAGYAEGELVRATNNTPGIGHTGAAAVIDVPGMAVSFSQVNGRRYRVSGWLNLICTVGGGTVFGLALTTNTNVYLDSCAGNLATAGHLRLRVDYSYTATGTGTAQLKLRAVATAAASYANMDSLFPGVNANPWAQLVVDDMGT